MSSLTLFAQPQIKADSPYFWLIVIVIMVAVLFFTVAVPLMRRFKRCPSNRVLVIFGRSGGREPVRCIHGGMAFVMPLIQDYAWLSLEPTQVEIPLRGAVSADNVRIDVTSRFTVAIGTTPELMQNAAARLLGLGGEGIGKQAAEVIVGQLHQVIALVQSEDLHGDREKFLASMRNSLEAELSKIGLVLISVIVTDVADESGRQQPTRPFAPKE